MNGLTPHTGFGYDYTTSVKFTILHPDQMFVQWSSKPNLSYHPIRNSNTVKVQYHGRAPWTTTMRLMLDSMEDFENLDRYVGRQATLWYRYGLSKRVGGTRQAIGGVDYLVLPYTIMSDISNEAFEIDGPCEADVTFQRLVPNIDYVDFATTGEDV